MKFLKPLNLAGSSAGRPEGYELCPIADQWAELLPERVPLRFSLFRYLGFYVAHTARGKSAVVRGRTLAGLQVTIRNEDKIIFSDRVGTAFRNGVFYVQDIRLDHPGVHTVTVAVEGALAADVEPLVLRTQVHEFMTLADCADLQVGPYAPLRTFVLDCAARGEEPRLRDDAFLDAFLRRKTTPLRVIDAKWWLKAYVEHTLDRPERQRLLQRAIASGRAGHKRKQPHPVRSGDKKEHDHLFDRRRREWKRVRHGELRMFLDEPLHAGATVTVYSSRDMYHQLSLYAQV